MQTMLILILILYFLYGWINGRNAFVIELEDDASAAKYQMILIDLNNQL
jgi:hypothetical protein